MNEALICVSVWEPGGKANSRVADKTCHCQAPRLQACAAVTSQTTFLRPPPPPVDLSAAVAKAAFGPEGVTSLRELRI